MPRNIVGVFENMYWKNKSNHFLLKLTSLACMVIMLDLTVGQIMYTSRVFGGCYPLLLAEFYVFMRDFLANLWAGIFFVILVIKWIETFKFHLVSRLNDEFWSIYLSILIIVMQLGYISFREMLGFHKTSGLKFISCVEMEVILLVVGKNTG